MKTRTRLIIISVIVIIVAVFFMWKWVFRQADSSVASKKAEVEISAPALIKAFETNENLANQKYNGKILSVSGIISDVKEDPQFISVYLKDTDATSGVMCSFNKGVVKLKEFKPGEKVKLKGICTGYLMDAVLNKCALE
jgi:hypothetical protein